MILCRAPLRIPIGGGGTDISSYYSKYGGFLISAAINKYIYVTINRRYLDNKIRVAYSKIEFLDDVERIEHNIVREALKLLDIKKAIEITSIADALAGCGLGTSSSFTVALLKAIHTLKKESVSTRELAEEACKLEIDILKEPIGKQDQYIAAFGGITIMDIDKNGDVSTSPLKMPESAVDDFESNILLFYTGISRSASGILAEKKESEEKNDPKVLEAMHRIKEIGFEIKKELERGNLHRFGELLDEHWQAKKGVSRKISNGQIDRWYEMAKSNGALGGKIMGAGGGGFFMFYCDNDKKRLTDVMEREGLKRMKFRIDYDGAKVIADF